MGSVEAIKNIEAASKWLPHTEFDVHIAMSAIGVSRSWIFRYRGERGEMRNNRLHFTPQEILEMKDIKDNARMGNPSLIKEA